MKPVGHEELKFDSEGEPYFLRTVDLEGHTEKITPQQCGYVKELEVSIIVRREGYSPSMQKRVWFGLQKLKFTVPEDDRNYHFDYLFFNKHMGFPCIRHFPDFRIRRGDYTEGLDMSSEFIQKLGKAERLTPLKAKQLVQDKAVLGIFNDFENQLAERV